MSSVLVRTYRANGEGIHNAVNDLKNNFACEQEVIREQLHRNLVIALHFPDLFKKARMEWIHEP